MTTKHRVSGAAVAILELGCAVGCYYAAYRLARASTPTPEEALSTMTNNHPDSANDDKNVPPARSIARKVGHLLYSCSDVTASVLRVAGTVVAVKGALHLMECCGGQAGGVTFQVNLGLGPASHAMIPASASRGC